jgi:hypothetical protein
LIRIEDSIPIQGKSVLQFLHGKKCISISPITKCISISSSNPAGGKCIFISIRRYEDFCAELLEHIQRQELQLQSSEQRALEKSMFMWQQTQSGTQHIDPIDAAPALSSAHSGQWHDSVNAENSTESLRKQLDEMRLEHRNLQERVQEEVENARNHAEITLKDAELCWKRERDVENAKWRKTVG